jgi:hypothetical protein
LEERIIEAPPNVPLCTRTTQISIYCGIMIEDGSCSFF